jgi:hypothetical protein
MTARCREAALAGELVDSLLADAEELGDLDEAQLTGQENVPRFVMLRRS